jgi:hypothetical protein
VFRPWFRLIARVGETGTDEYFLDPVKARSADGKVAYRTSFKVERSGEIFLYVNDAVIALPWLADRFYGNNHGSAKIEVRQL